MSRPYFSICIPNYNYEKYIGETIESVLAQDCQDFEIVVADNASTDGSVAVVERLAAKSGGKIRLFRNRANVGFAVNLERAARPAVGRFMMTLSSDDVMYPGALSTYKRVLDHLGPRAERTVIASTARLIEGDRETDTLFQPPPWFGFQPTPDLLPADPPCRAMQGHLALVRCLEHNAKVIGFVSTMYPRALYDAVEGYACAWPVHPDFAFDLKLFGEDPLVVFVDRLLFGYRMHPSNVTSMVTSADAPLLREFDHYQVCVEYNARRAARLGADHAKMVRETIKTHLLHQAGKYVAQSDWVRGFRLFALAWALYPRQTLKLPLTYVIGGLLALGPAAPPVARAMLRMGIRSLIERPDTTTGLGFKERPGPHEGPPPDPAR